MTGGIGAGFAEPAAAVAALVTVLLYVVAALRLRRRGVRWPALCDVSFALGGGVVALSALVSPPGGELTAHMLRHLAIGMAAPLLLVLGRPITLALRTLPPAGRGRLLAVLGSPAATWPVFPPLAAAADIGGLWALYRTPVFAATHQRPWLHALVHLHVLAAGTLFTFAVCQLDPVRHRRSLILRGATLVAAGAAHGILSKSLYAGAPPGTAYSHADLHAAAEVMYYGGDAVQIALTLVLALQWYAGAGRALARTDRRNATIRAADQLWSGEPA